MSSRLLQKNRIVLTMLSVQQLCAAQGITLASQPSVARPEVAQYGESRNKVKSIKDLLVDLGKQHQISMLFEEETVKNITVTGADYRQEGRKLEKQPTELLKPFNLRFKKAGKRRM